MRSLVTAFVLSGCLLLAAPVPEIAKADTASLPKEVARILKRHGLPASRTGLYVAWEEGGDIAMLNLDRPFNPASSIKLVTSMAALDLLGPYHKWTTSMMIAAPVVDGNLRGDLYLRGEGDPYLTNERLAHLVLGLRRRGIDTVAGDVVVDDTAFDIGLHDPSSFDGAGTKPYNAAPGASVVNFGSTKVVIHVTDGKVDAFLEPPSTTFEFVNQLKIRKGKCNGNWRRRIRERLSRREDGTARLIITGSYPSGCGERSFFMLGQSDPAAHLAGAVTQIFTEMGGTVLGSWRKERTPRNAKTIVAGDSGTLAEVIRGMNKYSNNFMARNIFLSIGGNGHEGPISLVESRTEVTDWFAKMGIDTTGLHVDNGSGLSRSTRITPRQFGKSMLDFSNRSYKHELIASMAVLGRDGTARRWNKKKKSEGNAHIKTGTLANARSTVGVIHNPAGDILFVMMVETRGTAAARRAIQELLDWAYRLPDPKAS